jgi:HSP20 family molecular chaperone IbpA
VSTLHSMAVTELPIRFEEYGEKNRYVVRLELPGIDLGKALEVSVSSILEVSVGWAEKPAARQVKVLTLADAE